MATLVFSALGTLVGGPVGGAIGALIGREADRAIIGTPTREGARLTELAVSSSTYGQPIARLFGATRAAGTIVWATDLRETSETVSGGKGQPKTRQYSYSISLAVALSSRPILGIGRIWADGNLLRGTAGDLKAGGTLRVHSGHADQAADPLLAATLGAQCPAHRGLAYVVFEDLQLGDFGNRIPALSFEVFADGSGEALVPALVEAAAVPVAATQVPEAATIAGFAHEGRTLAQALDLLARTVPVVADAGGAGLAGEHTLELPATLSADGARALIEAVRRRAAANAQRLRIRVAALDGAIAPGTTVTVPNEGTWRVSTWEWRSGGVELELERHDSVTAVAVAADAGSAWRPADRLPAETQFEAFELPWDGSGAADVARVHAALGAGAGRWSGAALYVERAGALLPLGSVGPIRSVMGRLEQPLAGSPSLLFEPGAVADILCDAPDAGFLTSSGAAFAAGANRLLVGEEILQFMQAEPLGAGRWRLAGLLRGRGATEAEAREGHAAGTRVCLIDNRVQLLDGAAFDAASERLAAIGAADPEPIYAAVRAPGRSRRPFAPVHPVAQNTAGGGLLLEWTRRARGAWAWRDDVDVPLVEEAELYEVGAGPSDAPVALWHVAAPMLALAAADLAAFAPGTLLWVRQIGSHAASPPLALHLVP